MLLASGGITAVNLAVASGVNETVGNQVLVTNFTSIDARILDYNIDITAGGGANEILTGAGDDTIDGGGGDDTIRNGAGDDLIYYYGAESVISGGGGVNTLVLLAPVALAWLATGRATLPQLVFIGAATGAVGRPGLGAREEAGASGGGGW